MRFCHTLLDDNIAIMMRPLVVRIVAVGRLPEFSEPRRRGHPVQRDHNKLLVQCAHNSLHIMLGVDTASLTAFDVMHKSIKKSKQNY